MHTVLTDASEPCRSVTAVALEYGFTHLGRFSDLYKSAYGKLPSQSIRCREAGQAR